ncbi:MAG: class I SAM-dependent methyltransferase, partial [Firmicutes bacterium]|nr:class I SAM-dependent methyltransferase [Bacillota bacterium]
MGLKYFNNKGWAVTGLDYSEFGCKSQNPDFIRYVKVGEIVELIESLTDKQQEFHVIWLDNVLEHVLAPLLLLDRCTALLRDNGVLVIEVPNDFSVLQQYLFEKQYISEPFWIAVPDHISYFNSEGLTAICRE